jgi:hypothetical protein
MRHHVPTLFSAPPSFALVLALGTAAARAGVDFDRQVRPILADNCFACHGPDAHQRKAKLRLDTPEGALGPRPGGAVIVPGDAAKSELVRRITADEAEMRMPPAKTGKSLTAAQIDVLRRWIDEGAKWSAHWSFRKPQRPPLPDVALRGWVRNPIDCFVLARLEKEGLAPAPEADRTTLVRRLTLDLTGLPPTPAEVDAFLGDERPGAYERLVERLLASPRYGERMALEWLDAARFADTHGYHIDSGRDMSRWREWVIDAFNRNKPFDEFTVEQIAGDLLPNPTLAQKVASGFHRNHMINFEGGAIPQEYHNAYIVDRVNTTGTVWLGLSVACAQCHDHKFDPLTQREFYQLYAFFHNVPENGLDGSKGNASPLLKAPSAEQQRRLDRLEAEIKDLEKRLSGAAPKGDTESRQWKEQAARLKKARGDLYNSIPSTMVMQEMAQPRETFLLVRGQYDRRGEKVRAATPAFLPPLPAGAPPTRLGLARWLVDPSQPLTARVTVNRYWQMYFGTGLVKTAEDFGTQGERPSHPELLDWLACEFVGGWDVKGVQRLIVTSATYRQSSAARPELLHRDPENRLLARAPRLRLPAEFIRDQALAVSGLLNGAIGGPSVAPYQPAGLWEELASRLDGANWTAQTYVQSKGRDLYRRTMYTFWKRTSPPPTLTAFDAPDRETCTVRRARTNTPLQALILLNDPTYVEASRKLAERILAEGGRTTEERIAFAFRLVTARRPRPAEVGVLARVFETQLAAFRKDPRAALKLLKVGESPRDDRLDPAVLAAWGVVAGVILNLDEAVTRG